MHRLTIEAIRPSIGTARPRIGRDQVPSIFSFGAESQSLIAHARPARLAEAKSVRFCCCYGCC